MPALGTTKTITLTRLCLPIRVSARGSRPNTGVCAGSWEFTIAFVMLCDCSCCCWCVHNCVDITLAFNWWWWVFIMTSNQAGGNSCWNSCNIERSAARWRSLYTRRSTRHLSTLKRILPVDFVGENFCLFVMKPYLAGCLTDWRIVWLIGDWWLGAVLSSGLVGSLACCVGGATLQWDP